MYQELFINTCGMFNIWHYLTIVLFFFCLWLLLRLSRNMTASQVKKCHVFIAIGVTVLEVIKIFSRIRKGYGPDSWVPLYYCSLFLFAIWLSLCRCEPLQRAGYAFITMGGILAAVGFTLYPSTSLGMYPLLHPSTLHSFVYHLVMCYTGLLFLQKNRYRPQKGDSLYYFCFVTAACILALFVNESLGTNCMFLSHPFGLPMLQPIRDHSHILYILIAILGQSVAFFWLHYGLYQILHRKAEII